MPYLKEVCIAGNTKEITKRFSSRYGIRNINRSKNSEPTPEAVKKINQRNAETKLRRLINTNFTKNDIHVVLTYRKEERPEPKAAKKQLTNFLRRLKRRYIKLGSVLKYIAVTEYKGKAIHHHLIINSVDIRDIQDLWAFGKMRPTYMDDKGDYAQLASYLIKETSKTFNADDAQGRRWNASQNLKQPKITKTIVAANKFRKDPKPEKGYYIDKDSIRIGQHEVTGMFYQFYRMIKLERGSR